MNNLDVTKFGVQELNAKEMVEVDGGGIGPWMIGVGFYLYDNRDSVGRGMRDAINFLF